MDLSLYSADILKQYKSQSQIARRLSESWFASEMYCPCCLNKSLNQYPPNTNVWDFFCERCGNQFQAKSSSRTFGKKVVDGEFYTMSRYIQSDRVPNFFFMQYSSEDWIVNNLFLVPKFFFSSSVIEKRKPLSASAERAGWTGCNIRLDAIPADGVIRIIDEEKVIKPSKINEAWKRMRFLNEKSPDLRGWTADVLKCVEDIGKGEFELEDVYAYERRLSELHPDNMHVRDKIRQQLQILRDNGIIRFGTRGRYSVVNRMH